jgi:glycine dehydrogenase
LSDVTGYEEVSLQPNAGSQGELAGLLAIRGYHLSRGDAQRTVCLIPSSAHGTNAASAVLAGMEVVVVACDENGNVDVSDLQAKISATGDKLASLMVTYPSTHGVYEEAIVDICEQIHAAGGQIYIDGANTNAVVGYAKFGLFGGDVSHLNLHKTFCIPHGGGGPGVGPVAARSHLKEFLPGHAKAQSTLPNYGPVSAAPYGSASILPISWAYIRMMGAHGLQNATAVAVLLVTAIADADKSPGIPPFMVATPMLVGSPNRPAAPVLATPTGARAVAVVGTEIATIIPLTNALTSVSGNFF